MSTCRESLSAGKALFIWPGVTVLRKESSRASSLGRDRRNRFFLMGLAIEVTAEDAANLPARRGKRSGRHRQAGTLRSKTQLTAAPATATAGSGWPARPPRPPPEQGTG